MQYREQVISGSIVKTIFTLATPVTLGMMMELALTVTDFYWVGKLGPSAQDAVTSSMVVIWTMFALFSLITIGLNALVSRAIGANLTEKAVGHVHQGMAFSLFMGLLVGAIGYSVTPGLMTFMEAPPHTWIQAVTFLRIFFMATPFFTMIEACYTVFRASGNTRTPMVISMSVVTLNMVLDPLLIFGIGPFPALGVAGASTGSLISIGLGSLVTMALLRRGKAGFAIDKLFGAKPNWAAIRHIARIGLPISTQQFMFVVVYWFLIKIVHQFGETAGAAMGIGNRMESFSYMTCYGISLAASTMVGQNLGAKQPDRAARCAWGATGVGLGLTLIMTILFLVIPRQIAGVFTDDPGVLKIATDYLIILGLSQSAMAMEIILEGAFSGAGDTLPPMLILLPGAIIRIPLAYYLAFEQGWGINGVWWTLTITTGIKASLLAYWFGRGRWKAREV